MNRRAYLKLVSSGTALVAGCTGDGGRDIQDSDGDGVIDSEDYAPNDPEVQRKSDLQATDSITPTPTATRTDGPTSTSNASPTLTSTPSSTPPPTSTATPTPTPSPTPTPEANVLTVDDDYWDGSSRIRTYSSEQVTVVVDPEHPETDFDRARLYAGLYEFPRETVETETLGDAFSRSDGTQEWSVSLDFDGVSAGTPYTIVVALAPEDATEGSIDYDRSKTIMETDPFVLSSDGVTIERVSYPSELDDASGETFERNNVEGAYWLEVSGRTYGNPWTVTFFVYKWAHAAAVNRSRGRTRPEYVTYELTDGSAAELASILKDHAEDMEFTEYEEVEFVIDFVQSLPYVPDDVSRGYDDYTKFIMETLPEMGGDCEDTSIMLASLLEAEPFGYDMILIQPPEHMAAGIWQEDPSGYYWERDGRKYAYIETTGQGWEIGALPEEYRGSRAYTYQV